MCSTVCSEGPDCNAPATSLILIISGVKYSKNRSPNSLDSVDPPKSIGTIRRLVLPKISTSRRTGSDRAADGDPTRINWPVRRSVHAPTFFQSPTRQDEFDFGE